MKSFFTLAAMATFQGAFATYVCPTAPNMMDMDALQYAYTIQELMNQYYSSVPVNASFFGDLPMASMTASNGMTLAENTVSNVEGLGKQASLGSEALMDAMTAGGAAMNMCNYMLPAAPNASAHLMNAFNIEASLCGAFIGLANYFQDPTLNSLSARLAAEHGIHASAIRGMMQPVGFMANSTMLTPAFTPDTVLMTGMEVGMLGGYLSGCAQAPSAPCGGSVSFGPLVSSLMGQSMSDNSSCNSMGGGAGGQATATITSGITSGVPVGSSTGTATGSVATYTGDATKNIGSVTTVLAMGAAFMAWMLS